MCARCEPCAEPVTILAPAYNGARTGNVSFLAHLSPRICLVFHMLCLTVVHGRGSNPRPIPICVLLRGVGVAVGARVPAPIGIRMPAPPIPICSEPRGAGAAVAARVPA